MGDSARFVLKGIEDMLQTEVKFFSMIRKEGERMYICLGKRALFLIDFEPPFQEQFYYAWVQRVIIDSDNLLLFLSGDAAARTPAPVRDESSRTQSSFFSRLSFAFASSASPHRARAFAAALSPSASPDELASEIVSGTVIASVTVVSGRVSAVASSEASGATSTVASLVPELVSGRPVSERVGASPPAQTGFGPSSAVSQPAERSERRVREIRKRWFKVASSEHVLWRVMLRLLGGCAKRVHLNVRGCSGDGALDHPR